MDVSKPKVSSKVATRATAPGSPHKGPPKFKQRSTRQFKSKPPKKGVIGYKYFLWFGNWYVQFLVKT
uniref:3',5'-cyclic-GMP phosphodiesterase n=1 Tax=Sinocyclocheilus grahami TaxID=75366 RepID=A0A672K9P2_SINGR